MTQSEDQRFMAEALAEARISLAAKGGPIGAVLVKDGSVIGRGHNRLYQTGDPTSHAEMEAYRNAARGLAGRLAPEAIEGSLARGIVCTTAMPCEMCASDPAFHGTPGNRGDRDGGPSLHRPHGGLLEAVPGTARPLDRAAHPAVAALGLRSGWQTVPRLGGEFPDPTMSWPGALDEAFVNRLQPSVFNCLPVAEHGPVDVLVIPRVIESVAMGFVDFLDHIDIAGSSAQLSERQNDRVH